MGESIFIILSTPITSKTTMKKASYTQRKNFVKFDNKHYLLYLNESEVDITNEETQETTQGYQYEGSEDDGSVKIEASEVTAENMRSRFIAGLIGNTYDKDTQIATLANGADSDAHAEELAQFNAYRSACKVAVDELLSRTL